MSGELATLLRVKRLKEDRALQEAKAKREAALCAAEEADRARKIVEDSAATLPSREDAIYREILGKVVKLDAIEITKGRVVRLEKEHGKLVDAQDRAVHVQAKAEAEREEAIQLHRGAVRTRDKYVLLTDREREDIAAAAEYREEMEVEDLFGTRRRGIL